MGAFGMDSTTPKNLLILGAGQYGVLAKEIAESMGCFATIAFLDDSYPDCHPREGGDLLSSLKRRLKRACVFFAIST